MKNADDQTVMTSPEYRRFIEDLKARVISARISAARAGNRDLILLYWDIGRGIVEKQQLLGWGEFVVEMVAADLRRAFPGMRGFSPANVWRMRQLHRVYSSEAILAQAAREIENRTHRRGLPSFLGQAVPESKAVQVASAESPILAQAVRELAAAVPWGHHALLLGRIKSPPALFYYLRATARFGWTRNVLLNQIKAGAYERAVTEKKSHNFPLALPEHLAEQADEMLKSRYNLTNPIGVAEYQLQPKLPAEFKGKLPTAKQLADVVRSVLPERRFSAG